MKTVSHPLFIVLFVIYGTYYGLKQTNIVLPELITSYLADLFSVFLVNALVLWIVRKAKGLPQLEFHPVLVLLSVVLFSFYFEYYLPQRSSIYTSDIGDVFCYFISGFAYVFWRKPLTTNS